MPRFVTAVNGAPTLAAGERQSLYFFQPTKRPGTYDTFLKIFSPKNVAKNLAI
jgi:hypothetical protein